MIQVASYLHAIHNLEKEKLLLKKNIVELVSKYANGWKDIDYLTTDLDHIGGAMTNLIFILSKPEGENKKVLIRIYGEGTDIFFKRIDEIKLFKMISEKEIGIELIGEFNNGRIEKMIDGQTCTSLDIRNPNVSAAIGAKLGYFHTFNIPLNDKEPQLIFKLNQYYEKSKNMCTSPKYSCIMFDKIKDKIKDFTEIAKNCYSPIVFCHNDLQYGNIMIKGNEINNKEVVLIDFEYSCYNPRGFDIGNHFYEWTYNYHKKIDPEIPNFGKYPTINEQKKFCTAYLNSFNNNNNNKTIITETDVITLLKEAQIYSLGSLLFWALWGFIQSVQSEINFNFLSYAMCRIEEFDRQIKKYKNE